MSSCELIAVINVHISCIQFSASHLGCTSHSQSRYKCI